MTRVYVQEAPRMTFDEKLCVMSNFKKMVSASQMNPITLDVLVNEAKNVTKRTNVSRFSIDTLRRKVGIRIKGQHMNGSSNKMHMKHFECSCGRKFELIVREV